MNIYQLDLCEQHVGEAIFIFKADEGEDFCGNFNDDTLVCLVHKVLEDWKNKGEKLLYIVRMTGNDDYSMSKDFELREEAMAYVIGLPTVISQQLLDDEGFYFSN